MKDLEDKYWQQIEELEWYTDSFISDGDYKRIEQQLKDNFTPSEAKQLDDFVRNKVNELGKRFNNDWLGDPGIDVSDDSWGDLRNEVVGRGKEFYENITVAKLQEMANVMDYHESFSYCFSFVWDIKSKSKSWERDLTRNDYNEKSENEKKTQFQLNKPKRIEEFVEKIGNLYDEYHAEIYQSNVWNYLEKAIKEVKKLK